MPRKTRKKLTTIEEATERRDREEGYQRLEVELHREWRQHERNASDEDSYGPLSDGATLEVAAYRSVL